MALSVGSLVRIEKADGSVLAGRLVTAGPDDITLSANHGAAERAARADVRRVFHKARRTAEKAKWGALFGAALGTVTSIAGHASAQFSALIITSWGGLGAAIGATDGASDWRELLVYSHVREGAQ